MESGDLPLEESVAQFEEASSLIKYCQQKLDEYKEKEKGSLKGAFLFLR